MVGVAGRVLGYDRLPTAVAPSGCRLVWYDPDGDGVWDVTERGIPGWTLQWLTFRPRRSRSPDLEPDHYPQYTLLNDVLNGVTLAATGYDVKDARVGSVAAAGSQLFGAVRYGVADEWVTQWTFESRNLRIDLDSPTTTISLDAVGPAAGGYGRLEVYDAAGRLLGRSTTKYLAAGAVETMTWNTPTPQIAYAIVKSTYDSAIQLDNLRVGAARRRDRRIGAYARPICPRDIPGAGRTSERLGSGRSAVRHPRRGGRCAGSHGVGGRHRPAQRFRRSSQPDSPAVAQSARSARRDQ